MTEREIISKLVSIGVLIQNSHIVYTSGRHGNSYVNKDALYPHTQLTSQLTGEMAKSFAQSNVEVVVAPALGGIVLSQWIAYHLSQLKGREVLALYAEKDEAAREFQLKRGYDKLVRDRQVLVLEDVLTTGGSVTRVVELVRKLGGTVLGVSALCNRGDLGTSDLSNVPKLATLISLNLKSWPAEQCPLCQSRVPINTEVGKGGRFLQKDGH